MKMVREDVFFPNNLVTFTEVTDSRLLKCCQRHKNNATSFEYRCACSLSRDMLPACVNIYVNKVLYSVYSCRILCGRVSNFIFIMFIWFQLDILNLYSAMNEKLARGCATLSIIES